MRVAEGLQAGPSLWDLPSLWDVLRILGQTAETAGLQKLLKFAFPPARGASTAKWTWKGERLLFNFAVAIVID